MNEQRFTLDVSKEPAVLPVLYLGQGDKNGTTLVAELYDNGTALSASGYTPSFEMRLPGGKAYYKADGTLSGNVATIPIDETYAAAVAGRACTAYVSLKSGGNVVSTTRMTVAVLESATNDVNPGQAYENGVEEFLEDAQEQLDQATADAESQVAQAQAQATAAIAQAQADQQQAADDLNAALDALGDISEVAVPLMSETTRGGAKLGSGLKVDDGKLSLGDVVTDSHDGPIYSVDAKGWAEQDGTPTPDYPQEIRVCRGRNLLDAEQSYEGTVSSTYYVDFISNTTGSTRIGRFELEAGVTYALSADVESSVGNFSFSVGCGNGTYASDLASVANMNNGRVSVTFTPTESTLSQYGNLLAFRVPRFATVQNITYKVSNVQLELGSTATPYMPYGHVGLEVQGRNLFDPSYLAVASDITKSNGKYSGTSNAFYKAFSTGYPGVDFDSGSQYTLSLDYLAQDASKTSLYLRFLYTDNTYDQVGCTTNGRYTLTSASGKTVSKAAFLYGSSQTITVSDIQLELGSTPTAYQPYHHTTTPIPLPVKGWAGGLPDGTADELSVDSAGRYEWTNAYYEVVLNGANTEYWQSQNNGKRLYLPYYSPLTDHPVAYLNAGLTTHFKNVPESKTWLGNQGFSIATSGNRGMHFSDGSGAMVVSDWRTWLASNPVTVFYPLATPTTEHGYIDLPEVPEGAVIDIPELREVGVRCFVHGVSELVDHANNWGARCKENESRIAALEAAIAEIATA